MEPGQKNQRARSERQRSPIGLNRSHILRIKSGSVSRGRWRWRSDCAKLLRALAQSQRGAIKAETGRAPSLIFHSSRWGVLYLSCGLSQPLKIGLRFSTKALRDSMRSLFAP
jgi:hypothetical protein